MSECEQTSQCLSDDSPLEQLVANGGRQASLEAVNTGLIMLFLDMYLCEAP